MADAPAYLVDTNILLRLTRLQDPNYTIIQSALRVLLGGGAQLYFALQNIAEFWNVCTRPADRNGFGLSCQETVALVESIERTMNLLPENEAVYEAWRRIVETAQVIGVHVDDARLAAMMEAYGIARILTLNCADFVRFSSVLAVHPADVRQP